jgi:hypothetical protein
MKSIKLFILTAILSASTFASVKIGNIEMKGQIQVAEVSLSVEIYDNNYDDDASFDCKVGAIRSVLSKKFGSVVKVEGLDSKSSSVIHNSVDDAGKYEIKLRITFY